ncbi:hypothetical protein [Schlesneria sp. T3-172]|uniref:hypothetical protein n=1 Tax=Schlesneria sphaerica TaxID=3373610 RepID=UPI0037C9F68E
MIVIRFLAHSIRLLTALLIVVAAQQAHAVDGISSAEDGQIPAESSVRFSIETNSRLGNFAFVPDRWGEFQFRVENRSGAVRKLLCTTYFADYPTLQYGRQLTVPARSRLQLSHPVRLPLFETSTGTTANIHTLVIDESEGKEVLIKNDSGQLRHDRSLVLTSTDRNTGIIAGWRHTSHIPQDVVDLVVANRVNQGLNNRITVIGDQFLPANETSYDYLDHIVIADDRVADDVAALATLRRWVHSGGNLWIMLDRVDAEVLERLLGDQFAGRVVGRVRKTSVRIDKGPNLASPKGEPGNTVEYDEPVEMVQLLISGMRIVNTVDGWPAALTGSFGEGRVLLTTLGARAWVNPTPEAKRLEMEKTPGSESAFLPNSRMEDLAAYVLARREPEIAKTVSLESQAVKHVSYKVPTWGLIVATMSTFLVLLLVAAVGLQRLDRLEHFGWCGSLLAVVFGFILTGIGVSNRYGVPGTVAGSHLLRAIGGTDDLRAEGVTAVYRTDEGVSLAQMPQGGKLWPEKTDSTASTRRLIASDLGSSRWDGLPQEAGLSLYTDALSQTHVERVEAIATLDSAGLVGTYRGPEASRQDALLATRNGRIGVKFSSDGEFVAKSEDTFGEGQFLDATYVGDQQDRRLKIFQELFANARWKNYLDHPHLLVWLDKWDSGFNFGDGLIRQGDALLAIRLNLTRPPQGTEVLIPSMLVNFSTRRPPDGTLPAGFWDDLRKEWQERSSPSTTWLRFQLPRELLPLSAKKARLEVRVTGPIGRLEILGIRDNASVSLASVVDPANTVGFDLDDSDVLAISQDGDLSLGISGGDTSRSQTPNPTGAISAANTWRIESLDLHVWATATDSTKED